MKLRVLALGAAALAAALLSGCVSYGYRGGSGDYYYGRGGGSAYPGYYGTPYGSVGYSRYGGWWGGAGYRYGYGHPYYYGRPGYGYYPPRYYYPRPHPPGHGHPPQRPPQGGSNRPPWRDLGNAVQRVEHRERPQRLTSPPPVGAPRPQGARPQPAPWRGGGQTAAPRPAGPPAARPVRSPTRPMAPRAVERPVRVPNGDRVRNVER